MTGQQLFQRYVAACLCVGEYRWYHLTPAVRSRWNNLAAELTLALR